MKQLSIAVLTVSDTRSRENDTSGDYLTEQIRVAGHCIADRTIIADDVYQIRSLVSQWIANETIDVIVTTGGTGFSGRDQTPEALVPLFDQRIEGFGELFRQMSYDEIGSSTIQSRAVAGIANRTLIFAVPGSTGACRTAWTKILREQLDESFKPCNFAEIITRFHNDKQ